MQAADHLARQRRPRRGSSHLGVRQKTGPGRSKRFWLCGMLRRYRCGETIPSLASEYPTCRLLAQLGELDWATGPVKHLNDLRGSRTGGVLGTPLTPLLKVERDTRFFALIAQCLGPSRIHGTSPGAALSARDYPVEAAPGSARLKRRKPLGKIHRAQQRFAGNEAHGRRILKEFRDAFVGPLLLLRGRADPDVSGPILVPRHEATDVLRSLGQKLPVEPGRVFDQWPQSCAPRVQVVAVLKYIGHRGAKDAAAFSVVPGLSFPLDRVPPRLFTKKSALSPLAPKLLPEPFRPSFRVTELARGRNPRAAPPGIKGVVGPFNC